MPTIWYSMSHIVSESRETIAEAVCLHVASNKNQQHFSRPSVDSECAGEQLSVCGMSPVGIVAAIAQFTIPHVRIVCRHCHLTTSPLLIAVHI